MNYSNIKNFNQRQFNATMKRECITVSDYYDRTKTYDVFFRRSRRGSNPQGKVRIYFSQDTPIDIGTMFVLKDDTYVVTSRDGDESDVFYTSMAVKCDTSFTVYSNTEHRYVSVPFVTLSDKFTLSSNSNISMISGSVVIYTGDNPYSREVEVNENYYNYGGYYEVANTFYNNGLAYVYMTREAKPQDRYTLSYTGVTSLNMKDATTYQLSYTAIKNDVVVNNPTLSYTSSDNTIATVDRNGLMTLLKEGNVKITAIWIDGNNTTCETTIAISNGGVQPEPTPSIGTLTISGRTTLKLGVPRTYKAKYTDANDNDVSSNYTSVWTITNANFNTSLLTQTVNGNQITLHYEDENIIGETFTLNVVDTDGTFTPATMDIELVDVM